MPRARADVLCIGETLWDLSTPRGVSFTRARSLRLVPGGGAANTALELASRGIRSALWTTVGDDPLGHALLRRLADAGVSTDHAFAAAPRTDLAFADLSVARRPAFVGYRPAAGLLQPGPELGTFRAVHLSGLAPSRPALSLFRRALATARRAGAVVSIDLNARPLLWRDVPKPSLRALLRLAHWVKASPLDLRTLRFTPAELRLLLRADATLLVTRGPAPTEAFTPRGTLTLAPRPHAAPDPRGAGDAFCAAVVQAHLASAPDARSWPEVLASAHRLARARLTRQAR